MDIQSLHQAFIMPTKASDRAGAFDIFMPEGGIATGESQLVGLGFAAAIPEGHVGLLLPRSSAGAKHGVELNNTCGVIDSDYRGEWKAAIKTKSGRFFSWAPGDRVLQFLIVPIANVQLNQVESLDETQRGEGGFGSTGQ
jgi:dUTP pyrophosphatase